MPSLCQSCEGEIVGDSVICQGFCNATFHPRCCGVAADTLNTVLMYNQVFWFCKSCTVLMKDIRFKNSARSAYESGQDNGVNIDSDTMQCLKSEILADLKAEIRSNFAALMNSNTFTPKSTRPPGVNSRITTGRRLFPKVDDPKPVLMQGTGSTLSPSTDIGTVPASEPKFWLYLSRIARDVSADQVSALAKKRLGTDDVQAVRLVARGRDLSTLTFVSFKLGMNADLKTKALSTSTWPKGVAFREFSDNRSGGNFWKPGPSLNDPTPTISPGQDMMD